MCGISGYISDRNLVQKNALSKTINLMKLRGPDANNYTLKEYPTKQVALLHSRLNIIDLHDRSNQPFIDDNLTLIFNGEIYNFLEIKKKLKHKYNFKTKSDTEVLLRAFQEYGEKCVDHFIGMWAFAIWDDRKKELFISRDPFGEKPLYYFLNEKGFFFGSEIKYIKTLCNKEFSINKGLIKKNLFLGYKSLNKNNDTFYNKIYSLESSTNLKINLNLNLNKKRYWKPIIKINKSLTKKDAIDGVKYFLEKSLKFRLKSDVPIAFCLSGGIDSASLASITKKKFNQKISTFSIIDDDKRYNEEENINIINNDLECDFNLININKKNYNFFDRMNMLVKQHDGPIATISYFIHSFLSEEIASQGYKVSISGTGADEIFTGYYDHYLLHLEATKNSHDFDKYLKDWKKFIFPNLRNPNLKDPFLYIKNKQNRRLVYENDFNIKKYSNLSLNPSFKEEKYCKELLRNRMLNELFYEVVPVILKHDDLNSMLYSIENRSPYLDRDLIEFSSSIPSSHLIENGYQKKILREATSGILIDEIRLDRKKKGFNASINSILNLDNPEVRDYIFNEKSKLAEFINLKKVKKDLDTKFIPNHLSKFIFSLLGTKIFLESN